LGLAWQKKKEGYFQLDGLWTLNLAIQGKYLFVSDSAELLTAMLANMRQKATQKPAIFVAGFDHQRERKNFLRLTKFLDKPTGDAAIGETSDDGPAQGESPHFFSGNIGSLSSTLSGLASERIVIRDAGKTIHQTVTYEWAH
jgi:hypothetical protein